LKALVFRLVAVLALACAPLASADCGIDALQKGGGSPEEWEAVAHCQQADAARAAGLPDLEQVELPAGQSETRIRLSSYGSWFDPMLRLRRYPRGSVQGALYYEYPLEDFDSPENRFFRRLLRDDCGGVGRGKEMGSCRKAFQHVPRWRELMKQLEELGIESIPDQKDLPPLPPSEEGVIPTHSKFIYLEVRNADGYRRYLYDLTRGPQAKAVEQAYWEIVKLLQAP
jgi:hypothetical protein